MTAFGLGFMRSLLREEGRSAVRGVIFEKGARIEDIDKTEAAQLSIAVHRDGVWGSLRHLRAPHVNAPIASERAYVDVGIRGNLSTLAWYALPGAQVAPAARTAYSV